MATRFSLSIEPTRTGRSVALLHFDRPPVNAIDRAAKVELLGHTEALARDRSIGALVIHGSRHFSVGDDIKEMAAEDPTYALAGGELISTAVGAVAALPFPVIAAVRGYALGGGCELALAADFRLTTPDAVWGLPEIHLGLIPAGGGTQRLPRLVGPARAKRMIYLGEHIDGTTALEWGLADEMVDEDALVVSARALAERLCEHAPVALRAAKATLAASGDLELEAGLRVESAAFASLMTTADARAGMAAFITKEPVSFIGR